jgi:hypothetical protein
LEGSVPFWYAPLLRSGQEAGEEGLCEALHGGAVRVHRVRVGVAGLLDVVRFLAVVKDMPVRRPGRAASLAWKRDRAALWRSLRPVLAMLGMFCSSFSWAEAKAVVHEARACSASGVEVVLQARLSAWSKLSLASRRAVVEQLVGVAFVYSNVVFGRFQAEGVWPVM